MKFIHLSDLHLGKLVNEVSMTNDQAYILTQSIEIIDAEQPDAVVIAGDVYDKSVPPAEAVTLFDGFAIEDEGLTIANPGGFIEGVTIQNLLTAEPHGRNQLLADALKRVGLAEKTGRGIDRIFEGSLIYGRSLPDYSNATSTTVSLFIPRSKPDVQLARIIANEQNKLGRPLPINTLLVLNILKDIPRSNVNQIAEAVNLSEIIVKTVLDKAVESGLVEAYGAGRGRTYMLSHKLYQGKEKAIGYVRQKDIDEARYPEMIINMAQNTAFIARADVMELLHVSDSKAYTLLKGLVKRNILVPVNKGRYAKYRLKT